MLGLLDQMEAENPEDPSLAPKASVFDTDIVQPSHFFEAW